MLISDILKLPGNVSPEVPFRLLRKVAGHYNTPERVDGVTWRSFCRVESDANDKWGREVGAVCVDNIPAAFCLCRGKYGDEWDVIILDKAAYVSLYLKLLEHSDEFEASSPDTDIWTYLNSEETDMLMRAGCRDSRPPPERAESYNHLYYLLHLRGRREGVEVCAILHPLVPFLAKPADFVLQVASSLKNVRTEPDREDMIKITIIDEENPCSPPTS